MSMTVNKGTGMSDAEWNEIVRTTVKKEREEEAKAKAKVHQQRETMKIELNK